MPALVITEMFPDHHVLSVEFTVAVETAAEALPGRKTSLPGTSGYPSAAGTRLGWGQKEVTLYYIANL